MSQPEAKSRVVDAATAKELVAGLVAADFQSLRALLRQAIEALREENCCQCKACVAANERNAELAIRIEAQI